MNIVIIGAGKVGEELCISLAQEGHDVVLIEQDKRRLDQLINMTDITGINGNGAIYNTQLEAGVDHCDVFIAVSLYDETNIIAAITAKKAGAKYVVARVRDPEFSQQLNFVRENLGINLMINPELEAARDIARVIQFPSALGVEQFDNGRVNIVEVRVAASSALVGLKLRFLRERGLHVLVCIIQRSKEVIIPKGDTTILADDHLHVTGTLEDLNQFYLAAKSYKQRLNSALIIGGGRITRYLLPRLLRLKMRVKVLEINQDKADRLAAEFPEIEVVCGDGTNQSFLCEERMTNYDTVISLTGIDEENMLLSLYAGQAGVTKLITKVNRTDLLKVIDSASLGTVVTPRKLIADIIIRVIRALENSQGSNVEALYRMADNKVEAMLFQVKKDSQVIHITLKVLQMKENLMLAFIVRKDKLIFPCGTDVILPDDRVAVVTTQHNFNDLDDILA